MLDSRVSDRLIVCDFLDVTGNRVTKFRGALLHRGGKRGPVLELRSQNQTARHSVHLSECEEPSMRLSADNDSSALFLYFVNDNNHFYLDNLPARFVVMVAKLIMGQSFDEAYKQVYESAYFAENKKED